MQNAATDAMDEIFSIAEGLSRADIEPRARQAFAHASKCRAAYSVIHGIDERTRAASYAVSWAAILEYFDLSGAAGFSKDAYDELDGTPRMRVLTVLAFFDVFAWFGSFRVIWGSKPVAFYKPWGSFSRRAAGVPRPGRACCGASGWPGSLAGAVTRAGLACQVLLSSSPLLV
jgi:hypothetical protein